MPGNTPTAIAWLKLRHDIELKWINWDFVPKRLPTGLFRIKSLQECRQGRVNLAQPFSLIFNASWAYDRFDESWDIYSTYLQDRELNRYDVVEEFEECRMSWLIGARREFSGLSPWDPMISRFRYMKYHLMYLLKTAEKEDNKEIANVLAKLARDLLNNSLAHNCWPSESSWGLLRYIYKIIYLWAHENNPDAPPFDFDEETRVPMLCL
jgi:hypothetical protein